MVDKHFFIERYGSIRCPILYIHISPQHHPAPSTNYKYKLFVIGRQNSLRLMMSFSPSPTLKHKKRAPHQETARECVSSRAISILQASAWSLPDRKKSVYTGGEVICRHQFILNVFLVYFGGGELYTTMHRSSKFTYGRAQV